MEESFVGKTLKNDKGQEFIVLSQVRYKSLPCVYAMLHDGKDNDKEKSFFQISLGKKPRLVEIKSEKMKKALYELMFKETIKDEKPRKINDKESITSYFEYLDDYYKNKVTTII